MAAMSGLDRPFLSVRMAGVIAILAAALALGIALGSERWDGLVPCALCLVERWPYRVAIVLGICAALLPEPASRVSMGLLALTMLIGVVFAAIHVGVEFHWWPSPLPECAAPVITGSSIAERLAQLPAAPSKPCDEATYLIPGLKLSMAAMNLLFAAAFAVAAGWVTLRRPA